MKLFFLIFGFLNFAEAATLLVPEAQTGYAYYFRHCHNPDYVCSFDYFTRVLSRKPTPEFDKAMDEFDLNDNAAVDTFRNRLLHILNNEELSLAQLQMLLAVMNDLNRTLPSVYFQMIESELQHIAMALQAQPPANSEEFIFIFKKRFPLDKYRELHTSVLKIPLYLLHYASVPQKTNTRDLRLERKISLLTGTCGNSVLAQRISRISWTKLSAPACEKATTTKADFENKPAVHFHHEFQ